MQYSQTETNYGMGFQPKPGQPIPQQQPVQAQPGPVQPGQPDSNLVMPGQRIKYPPEYYRPYNTKCPHCGASITTEATYKIGFMNWLWCMICSLWAFCWCPFLVDNLKDVTHTCPNCKKTIIECERKDQMRMRQVRVAYY